MPQGWRGGSVLKSTGCHCPGGPRLCSQRLHGRSPAPAWQLTTFCNSSSGVPVPPSGSRVYFMHTHAYRQNTGFCLVFHLFIIFCVMCMCKTKQKHNQTFFLEIGFTMQPWLVLKTICSQGWLISAPSVPISKCWDHRHRPQCLAQWTLAIWPLSLSEMSRVRHGGSCNFSTEPAETAGQSLRSAWAT